MSSQVVVLPRKKTTAAAPHAQVSFLVPSVAQKPAQTALQTASKRARIEAKTEAQTDVLALVNEFRQEITTTETVVQTLTQVLREQQVQHKTLTEESESQARQNAALQACIERYASKYQQIDRGLDNFLLVLSQAKNQHHDIALRVEAAQQIAERMFEQKLKLADETRSFRTEFDALVDDTLQSHLSTTADELRQHAERQAMLEEDCRSHAHRLQTINSAANNLTHRLHIVLEKQRPSATQELSEVQQQLAALSPLGSPPESIIALRDKLAALHTTVGMVTADLASLEWQAQEQTARYKQTTFELEAAIKQRKTDVDELYDKATRCREKTASAHEHRQSSRDERAAASSTVASLDLKLERLNMAWEDQFAELHQRTAAHLAALQQKREADEAAYQAHVEEMAKKQETIVQLDKEVYVIQRQIDEHQAQFEHTRQRLQEQVAAELEQISSLQHRSQRSDSRLEQLTLERAETVNKLEAAQHQLQRHAQLCKEQSSRATKLRDDLASLQEEAEQARLQLSQSKEQLNDAVSSVLRGNEDAASELHALQQENRELQQQADAAQQQLAQRKQRMQPEPCDSEQIQQIAMEYLQSTDYLREEQALQSQLQQIQETCAKKLQSYRQAQEREIEHLRRTLEQSCKPNKNSRVEDTDDCEVDDTVTKTVSQATSSKQAAAPAPSRRTAKQSVFTTLGDARTPTAPSTSARVAASRSATVKKPHREAPQSQAGEISKRVASQGKKDDKPPLQAQTVKPKTAVLKGHLPSSQRQAPPTTSAAARPSAPAPAPPQRPSQRARLPSGSSSKKSIDWFDDEAFTF